MTGCDPPAVHRRFEGRRNARESDLRGCGEFGGGLVPELADRAILVDCMLLVTEDLGDRDASQRDRQGDDPGAPPGPTACEARMHGSSHWLSTLAEFARGDKGRSQSAERGPVAVESYERA